MTADHRFRKGYRFDYFKFTFPDVDKDLNYKRRVRIEEAVARLEVSMGDVRLREPKVTFLGPAGNRPDGLMIVEVWGRAAEALYDLPNEYAPFLTFAHIKTYATLREGVTYDKWLAMCQKSGFRKGTLTTPRKQRNSVKDSGKAGYTFGSHKSDLHFSAYQRPGERLGLEARFRDERLQSAMVLAEDLLESLQRSGDTQFSVWNLAAGLMAKTADEQLDFEILSRDEDLSDYLTGFSSMSSEKLDAFYLAGKQHERLPLITGHEDYEQEELGD